MSSHADLPTYDNSERRMCFVPQRIRRHSFMCPFCPGQRSGLVRFYHYSGNACESSCVYWQQDQHFAQRNLADGQHHPGKFPLLDSHTSAARGRPASSCRCPSVPIRPAPYPAAKKRQKEEPRGKSAVPVALSRMWTREKEKRHE